MSLTTPGKIKQGGTKIKPRKTTNHHLNQGRTETRREQSSYIHTYIFSLPLHLLQALTKSPCHWWGGAEYRNGVGGGYSPFTLLH